MGGPADVYELADGEVRLWIEQEIAIHLKAVSPHGDPVESSEAGARQLAAALLDLADRLDGRGGAG